MPLAWVPGALDPLETAFRSSRQRQSLSSTSRAAVSVGDVASDLGTIGEALPVQPRLTNRRPTTDDRREWVESGRCARTQRRPDREYDVNVNALQGALRMLFLLDEAGVPPAPGSRAEQAGAVAMITAERKLQALHFWMRNPDYLAYEIVSNVEHGRLDASWLNTAETLLVGEEPELRRYPMLRYRFGAYEPIDDSFSYLMAAGLAGCHRSGIPGEVQRTDFYLFQAGRTAAKAIVAEHSELQWYRERAMLVAEVGGSLSGYAAKKRQYDLAEYAETELGDQIRSVAELVRGRLIELRSRV